MTARLKFALALILFLDKTCTLTDYYIAADAKVVDDDKPLLQKSIRSKTLKYRRL